MNHARRVREPTPFLPAKHDHLAAPSVVGRLAVASGASEKYGCELIGGPAHGNLAAHRASRGLHRTHG